MRRRVYLLSICMARCRPGPRPWAGIRLRCTVDFALLEIKRFVEPIVRAYPVTQIDSPGYIPESQPIPRLLTHLVPSTHPSCLGTQCPLTCSPPFLTHPSEFTSPSL